jgi:hypothetical protein
MAWTAAKIPDRSGAVAVVTGANGGLGLVAEGAVPPAVEFDGEVALVMLRSTRPPRQQLSNVAFKRRSRPDGGRAPYGRLPTR